MNTVARETHTSLFFSQPKALPVLFVAELWERFSHYGLRALLIFYMTTELQYADFRSYGIYGMYFTLLHASSVIGGYLADNYLGNRKAIYLGGFIIMAGHCCLAFPLKDLLPWGLSFIIIGTGFFKSNINSYLGQYYHPNDPRRDGGFTIFYMGANLGGFLAPFVCGYIGKKYGWHYGFGVAGLGMLFGILVLFLCTQSLGDVGLSPDPVKLHGRALLGLSPYHWIILGCLASIPLFTWCLQNFLIMESFLNIFGVVMLLILIAIALKCEKEERKAMLTLITMFPFFTAFWASIEQAGGSMNLFAERHVDRMLMGQEVPATWFNPAILFLL